MAVQVFRGKDNRPILRIGSKYMFHLHGDEVARLKDSCVVFLREEAIQKGRGAMGPQDIAYFKTKYFMLGAAVSMLIIFLYFCLFYF